MKIFSGMAPVWSAEVARCEPVVALFVPLLFALLLLVSSAVPAAQAKPTLAPIFSDGLVLQRNKSVEIWGAAKPGERVEVQVAGQRKSASADAHGKWRVRLAPMPSGTGLELVVAGGGKGEDKLVVRDVAVGDVWLCSGQSNIGFPIHGSDALPQDLSDADTLKIHIFSQWKNVQTGKVPPGTWSVIDKAKVSLITTPAIPYLFARQLQQKKKVPTAILLLNCGGAPIETFLPPKTIKRFSVKPDSILPPFKLSENYRAYLEPFLRFSIKGILWYQGESNFNAPAFYKKIFPAFITDWRKELADPTVPLFFVQLPNHGNRVATPVDALWAELREAQTAALTLPDVYMVVSVDTASGDPAKMHPAEKWIIAQRLSEFALLKDRGAGAVPVPRIIGPSFKSFRIGGDRVFVTINNGVCSGMGLTLNENETHSFEVAGADRVFHWATARKVMGARSVDAASKAPHSDVARGRGDAPNGVTEIELRSDEVKHPVAARYAWADNPVCSVSGGGLPLAPFRTDRWPTHPQINKADWNPQ
ncbi:MAG TPA: sialate O-acetylesterase [Oculatellaceae cyanobacterium]